MLRSLDHVPVGTVIYTPNRGVVAVTPIFAEIVGRPIRDVLGARMQDFTHPDDIATNEWLLENAVRNVQPFTLVKRYLRPNGDIVWVENRYEVFAADGLKTEEPVVCLLSRRIDAIPSAPTVQPNLDFDYTEYVKDMTLQLAAMAEANGHMMSADLLRLAAKVAEED